MKKLLNRNWQCFLPGLLVLAAGCGGQRVVWSPDGKRAAVSTEQGIYLCDTNGGVSGLLVSNAFASAWFPDNRRLALFTVRHCGSWADLAAGLDATDRQRISDRAQQALKALKAGQDLKSAMEPHDLDDNEDNAVAVYLKASGEDMKKWVPDWQAFQDTAADLVQLRVGEISNDQVTLGRPLLGALSILAPSLRLSPSGNAALLTTEKGKLHGKRLLVVPTDGSSPAQDVSDDSCGYPDWSRDGRSVVYIRAVGAITKKDDLRLGCLSRRQVCDANGAAQLQSTTNEDLAGLLFDANLGVRCLSDGRILFSAGDVHLPATASDMPQYAEIFTLDPQRQGPIARLFPRSALETLAHAGFYDVSPDEKKVLVAGEKGGVSVITLATGDVTAVQSQGDDDVPSFPSWRGDEVCFMAHAPNSEQGRKWEVALWRDGHIQYLSTHWPDALRMGWLN